MQGEKSIFIDLICIRKKIALETHSVSESSVRVRCLTASRAFHQCDSQSATNDQLTLDFMVQFIKPF